PAPLELGRDDRADPGHVLAVPLTPSPVDLGPRRIEPVPLGAERDPVLAIGDLLEVDQELDRLVPPAAWPPREYPASRQERDRHGRQPLAPPSLVREREPPHEDAVCGPLEVIQTGVVQETAAGRDEPARAVARMLHEAAPHEVRLVAQCRAPGAAREQE